MREWKRHVGVVIVLFVCAVAVAFATPLSVDPREIFFGAVVLFFLYLGLSLILKK